MLERLLSMLAEGGLHTPTQLAGRLGVSERLVEQMLADLTRMGYLRAGDSAACESLPGSDPGPCADCPLAGACAVGEPGSQVWALTQKAFR